MPWRISGTSSRKSDSTNADGRAVAAAAPTDAQLRGYGLKIHEPFQTEPVHAVFVHGCDRHGNVAHRFFGSAGGHDNFLNLGGESQWHTEQESQGKCQDLDGFVRA